MRIAGEKKNKLRAGQEIRRLSFRIPVWIFLLCLALLAFSHAHKISCAAESSGLRLGQTALFDGAGTKDSPWKIRNIEDLEKLREDVAGGNSYSGQYLLLTADIKLPDDWQGVGSLKEGATSSGRGKNIAPFSGCLNGNGHTVTAADGGRPLFAYVREAEIRNLSIAGNDINGNGLIRNYVIDYGEDGNSASMPKTALIENVTIKSGTSILGSGFVSGYAAAGNTVDICYCTVEEGVVIGCQKNKEKVGSFGGDFNGTIIGCSSGATVYGTNYVGGIMGCKGNSMSQTSVSQCIFTGQVIASGNYAGGIAGGGYGGTVWGINTAPNAPMLTIRNCLCSGRVEAADQAGGIEGYETSLQTWENGIGYIENNLFTGSVLTTEGSCLGGIVGAIRGLDRYNYINDNYYSSDCGADRGIGGAAYVDTSCQTHESLYGEIYYDTSKEVPVFEGVNDVYSGNIKADHNREDDPLGADALTLAAPVTADQLADGTVTALLNTSSGSEATEDTAAWKQGISGPEISISYEPDAIADEDSEEESGTSSEEGTSENTGQETGSSEEESSGTGSQESGSGQTSSSEEGSAATTSTSASGSKKKVVKGRTYRISGNSYKVTKRAGSKEKGRVTLSRARNAKTITIPGTVRLADGRKYKVTVIAKKAFKGKKIRKVSLGANVKKIEKNAFAGSKVTTLILKTRILKKAKVKGCLKGSKIKTIKVRLGKKSLNKKYARLYKKIFTKKNAGKKAAVKWK